MSTTNGTEYIGHGFDLAADKAERDRVDSLPLVPPVREDGHSVGCNGYGILGFDVEATTAGPRITRYHYCVVPVRAHHTTTKEK